MTGPALLASEVTVPDAEHPDRELTARPHWFAPDRFVIATAWDFGGVDDNPAGQGIGVALTLHDAAAIRDAITAWLDVHGPCAAASTEARRGGAR